MSPTHSPKQSNNDEGSSPPAPASWKNAVDNRKKDTESSRKYTFRSRRASEAWGAITRPGLTRARASPTPHGCSCRTSRGSGSTPAGSRVVPVNPGPALERAQHPGVCQFGLTFEHVQPRWPARCLWAALIAQLGEPQSVLFPLSYSFT